MVKNNNDIYQFSSFLKFPELIHGFSSRSFGDMRLTPNEEARNEYASALEINPSQIVRMKQVHSSHVEQIGILDGGSEIPDTDGMVSDARNIFLAVITADCIPFLLYDRYKRIVGIVHAGWRGLYSEIVIEAVEKMIDLGSNPIDIVAGVGPCIRSCCYTIDEKRVDLFRNKFRKKHGSPLGYIIDHADKTYLNMPYLARIQLLEAGILDEHIEDSELCTFHTPDLYSYRREGREFNEFMGIIGRL
jgi:YfiH family protein